MKSNKYIEIKVSIKEAQKITESISWEFVGEHNNGYSLWNKETGELMIFDNINDFALFNKLND